MRIRLSRSPKVLTVIRNPNRWAILVAMASLVRSSLQSSSRKSAWWLSQLQVRGIAPKISRRVDARKADDGKLGRTLVRDETTYKL